MNPTGVAVSIWSFVTFLWSSVGDYVERARLHRLPWTIGAPTASTAASNTAATTVTVVEHHKETVYVVSYATSQATNSAPLPLPSPGNLSDSLLLESLGWNRSYLIALIIALASIYILVRVAYHLKRNYSFKRVTSIPEVQLTTSESIIDMAYAHHGFDDLDAIQMASECVDNEALLKIAKRQLHDIQYLIWLVDTQIVLTESEIASFERQRQREKYAERLKSIAKDKKLRVALSRVRGLELRNKQLLASNNDMEPVFRLARDRRPGGSLFGLFGHRPPASSAILPPASASPTVTGHESSPPTLPTENERPSSPTPSLVSNVNSEPATPEVAVPEDTLEFDHCEQETGAISLTKSADLKPVAQTAAVPEEPAHVDHEPEAEKPVSSTMPGTFEPASSAAAVSEDAAEIEQEPEAERPVSSPMPAHLEPAASTAAAPEGAAEIEQEQEAEAPPTRMPPSEPVEQGEVVDQVSKVQEKVEAPSAPVPTENLEAPSQLPEFEAAPGPITSDDGVTEVPTAIETVPEEPVGGSETGEPISGVEREEALAAHIGDDSASEAPVTNETEPDGLVGDGKQEMTTTGVVEHAAAHDHVVEEKAPEEDVGAYETNAEDAFVQAPGNDVHHGEGDNTASDNMEGVEHEEGGVLFQPHRALETEDVPTTPANGYAGDHAAENDNVVMTDDLDGDHGAEMEGTDTTASNTGDVEMGDSAGASSASVSTGVGAVGLSWFAQENERVSHFYATPMAFADESQPSQALPAAYGAPSVAKDSEMSDAVETQLPAAPLFPAYGNANVGSSDAGMTQLASEIRRTPQSVLPPPSYGEATMPGVQHGVPFTTETNSPAPMPGVQHGVPFTETNPPAPMPGAQHGVPPTDTKPPAPPMPFSFNVTGLDFTKKAAGSGSGGKGVKKGLPTIPVQHEEEAKFGNPKETRAQFEGKFNGNFAGPMNQAPANGTGMSTTSMPTQPTAPKRKLSTSEADLADMIQPATTQVGFKTNNFAGMSQPSTPNAAGAGTPVMPTQPPVPSSSAPNEAKRHHTTQDSTKEAARPDGNDVPQFLDRREMAPRPGKINPIASGGHSHEENARIMKTWFTDIFKTVREWETYSDTSGLQEQFRKEASLVRLKLRQIRWTAEWVAYAESNQVQMGWNVDLLCLRDVAIFARNVAKILNDLNRDAGRIFTDAIAQCKGLDRMLVEALHELEQYEWEDV